MMTKTASVLLLVLLSNAAALTRAKVLAQESNSKPQTVTLEARTITVDSDNYTKAAFSFKYGINGDEAVKTTGNGWDLLYGNISLNGDKDWFTVALVGDDRSRIRDLGELDWSDDIKIPILPPCPEECEWCTAIRLPSASSEKVRTDVNENLAKAVVAHMYLVHTKDRSSDFYTLFRVEELRPSKRCTISWKMVPSPKE